MDENVAGLSPQAAYTVSSMEATYQVGSLKIHFLKSHTYAHTIVYIIKSGFMENQVSLCFSSCLGTSISISIIYKYIVDNILYTNVIYIIVLFYTFENLILDKRQLD